jgi:hypothetical protein
VTLCAVLCDGRKRHRCSLLPRVGHIVVVSCVVYNLRPLVVVPPRPVVSGCVLLLLLFGWHRPWQVLVIENQLSSSPSSSTWILLLWLIFIHSHTHSLSRVLQLNRFCITSLLIVGVDDTTTINTIPCLCLSNLLLINLSTSLCSR